MVSSLVTKGIAAVCTIALLAGASGAAALAAGNGSSLKTAEDKLTKERIAVGYADQQGTRLLGLIAKTDNAKPYTQAICTPNEKLAIASAGYQQEDEQSNHRQNMWNFDHDEGALYQVKGKRKAEPNDSCILTSKDAWSGYSFPSYKAANAEKLSAAIVTRIEKVSHRKVIKHERIGTIGQNSAVALVEYDHSDGTALAAIALVTANTTVLYTLEGSAWDPDSSSIWRVDDGGQIRASHFRLITAAKSAKGYAIGLEWYGTESNAIFVLKQQGRQFAEVDGGSRYIAPV
ncbi:hypothetical protein [Paenibacillus kobensis]|uniref:hypothetical protein n=1 Tax=Paenibacillus kobensis TaxID=59841 RepID=UPI000FDA5CD1|nr:hypothetical protein [Paenibacillus kobensis]